MPRLNCVAGRAKKYSSANSNVIAARLSRAIFETLENRRLLSGTVATWTGAGGDALWSNSANWQNNTLPVVGQDVDFPAPGSGTQAIVTVDVSPTVGNLELDDTALQGVNTITLQGDITTDASTQSAILDPITLGHDTTINVPYDLVLGGAVDDGGHHYSLTVNGGGEIDMGVYAENAGVVALSGSGNISETYSGNTTLDNVELNLDGTLASSILAQNSYVVANHSIGGFSGTASGLFASDNSTGLPSTLTLSDGLSLDGTSLFYAHIETGSSYGKVVVDGGTIDLGSAALQGITFNGTTPADGDVLTIVQNNTGNPITGTFASMPEGSEQLIAGHYYAISYVGGVSGHDVTLTANGGPSDIWTDGAGTGRWSNPGNWSLGAIPIAGENVQFNTSGDFVNVDSASIDIGTLTLDHTNLSGNAITVEGNFTNTAGASIIDDAITLTHDATVEAGSGSIDFEAPISDGGNHYGITVLGGTLQLGVADSRAMTYTGTTEVDTGATLDIAVSVASPIVLDAGSTLVAAGHGAPSVISNGGTIDVVSPYNGQAQQLRVPGVLTLNSTSTLSFPIDSASIGYGDTSAGYGQIVVNSGTITLAGSLATSRNSNYNYVPPIGTSYTIIANNTGSNVAGEFSNLPEDGEFESHGTWFQIDYHGGSSGHDVVLTATKAPTQITVASTSSTANFGSTVTFRAAVSGTDANNDVPAGTVSFFEGSTLIGTESVVSGTATIDTTTLMPGTHAINAVYSGDSNFSSSSAATFTQTINPVVTFISATDPVRTATRFATFAALAGNTEPAGEAGLSYTWSVLAAPGGAKAPLMPGNGSNAAKNMTMRLYKDGTYLMQVIAADAQGFSATRTVRLIVSQTAKGIRLAPHAQQIAAGSQLQYSGILLDQFNHPMRTDYVLSWKLDTNSGSITSDGLFSSEKITGHVTVEADWNDVSGTVGATLV